MKVYFAGDSHLTHWSIVGAAYRKLNVVWNVEDADLVVIAEDMTTDNDGKRHLESVQGLIDWCDGTKPILLMSQVPPGFCRKQNMPNLYHYPETLRIKDAYERACNPEYIMIGSIEGYDVINDTGGVKHEEVHQYANAFNCPIRHGTYEEAEMCKIAVNTYLAMQVDYANRMKSACDKIGASWEVVANVIKNDKRIGPHAYLTPGRWQDSVHLLRDVITLKEIENAV